MRAYFQLALAASLIVVTDAHAALITLTVGDPLTPTLFAATDTANKDPNLANTYDILIPTKATPYVNDFAFVSRPMTIEASGGPVTLQYNSLGGTVPLLQDKGIIITTSDLTVKGITFQGAAIDPTLGGNGAGIRDQATGGTTLHVEGSSFVGNQNGILTAGSNFQEKVEIINSSFFDNGSGDGSTHALYVGDALSLLVQNSLFCGTLEGHDIKSRAMSTTVTGSHVFDGATGAGCANAGTTSYGIEATNGGKVVIDSTDITQGPGTANSTMLRYGADTPLYANSSLAITDSKFLSTSGGTGIQAPAGATGCTLSNTTFTGLGTNVDPAGFCTTATTPPAGPAAIPEPQSLWLLLTALGCGAAFFARRLPGFLGSR